MVAGHAATVGTRPPGTLAFLKGLPLLADLAAQDLERIAGRATRRVVAAGATVMEEGTAGDGLYILMNGELEVTRRENGGEIVLAVLGPGAFLGEMSLIEEAPRNATIRAVHRSELLVVEPAEFLGLLAASPAAALTILRTFAARLRSTESALRQTAHLASLGTLAAGLAHELSNPASALSRSARGLAPALAALERCARLMGELGVDPERLPGFAAMPCGGEPRGGDGIDLAGVNRAEDALADWLRARGIDRPADNAAALVFCGWSPTRLATLLAPLQSAPAAATLEWLAARCAVAALVDETGKGAAAISEIVGAVRAHSYLGRGAVHTVNVQDGLDSALTILRGRLDPGTAIVRDYAGDLPLIEAYGGELNQVWVNLIDNAIHAVDGTGTIELRATGQRDGVVVEVADSGPGIPAELLSRVFDPFFTTRPFGSGTGLGLHVSYTIVRRHGGRLHVTSRPGRTVFTVELPLRIPPRDP